MFRDQTAFIVGAGAGVDLDMLTGDKLCDEIAEKVNIAFEEGSRKASGDAKTYEQMRRIGAERRININDLMAAGRQIAKGVHFSGSIDSYIRAHNHDENIKITGKLGIVQTIIEYERRSKLFIDIDRWPPGFRDEAGVRKSWLRQFMLMLQDGIVVRKNLDDIFSKLMIVNFNYDRCIEQFFFLTLQDLFGIDANRAATLIKKLKIYHPYGIVSPLPWQTARRGLDFGGGRTPDVPYGEFINNIRTFNEEIEKGDDFEIMHQIFSMTQRFVFLGFHFHKQNLELLTPRAMQAKEPIEIYATALNRSESDIGDIKRRLGAVFGTEVRYGVQEYLRKDCAGLLSEFGARFTS